jgi:putative SOS response-associated peptidase YedK
MCFFYSVRKENTKDLIINNIISANQLNLIEDVYFANGYAHPKMPVLVSGKNENVLKYFSWGLIPEFCKTEEDALKIQNQTLNARAETVFEKNSFRNAIQKGRCLVLCSGFYEFYDGGRKKYPFFITLKNNGLFVFAGIFDTWKKSGTDEIIQSFSIITQESNGLVGALHKKHRMPVFLNFEDAKKYINPKTSTIEINAILNKKIEFEKLKAHSIAQFNPKSSKENNIKEISAFYTYPELTEYFRLDKDFILNRIIKIT